MKILKKKIGCFGWEVWLVRDHDGFYRIGLVDSLGKELYCKYYESENLKDAENRWAMI